MSTPPAATDPYAASEFLDLAPVARVLPPEEWHRLAHTDLGSQTHRLDPAASVIVVVEDRHSGTILACWAAMNIVHVEGVWVAPEAGAGTARLLLAEMTRQLTAGGVTEALTQALTPEIAALCERLGGHRVPGDTWVLPVTTLTLPPEEEG